MIQLTYKQTKYLADEEYLGSVRDRTRSIFAVAVLSVFAPTPFCKATHPQSPVLVHVHHFRVQKFIVAVRTDDRVQMWCDKDAIPENVPWRPVSLITLLGDPNVFSETAAAPAPHHGHRQYAIGTSFTERHDMEGVREKPPEGRRRRSHRGGLRR